MGLGVKKENVETVVSHPDGKTRFMIGSRVRGPHTPERPSPHRKTKVGGPPVHDPDPDP